MDVLSPSCGICFVFTLPTLFFQMSKRPFPPWFPHHPMDTHTHTIYIYIYTFLLLGGSTSASISFWRLVTVSLWLLWFPLASVLSPWFQPVVFPAIDLGDHHRGERGLRFGGAAAGGVLRRQGATPYSWHAPEPFQKIFRQVSLLMGSLDWGFGFGIELLLVDRLSYPQLVDLWFGFGVEPLVLEGSWETTGTPPEADFILQG